jgi:hypothetical protein
MTGETHLDDSAQVVQTEESRTTTTSSADSTTTFEAESTEEAHTIATESTLPDQNNASKRNPTTTC